MSANQNPSIPPNSSIDLQTIPRVKLQNMQKQESFNQPSRKQGIPLERSSAIKHEQSLSVPKQIKLEHTQNTNTPRPSQYEVLQQELQRMKAVLGVLRFMGDVILATSKSPIYSQGIGFDSQNEQETPQNSFDRKLVKIQPVKIKVQEDQDLYPNKSDFQVKLQDNQLRNTTMFQLNFEKYEVKLNGSDFQLCIPYLQFHQPRKLKTKLQLVKDCLKHQVNQEQKRKFLELYQKAESLKRGIMIRLSQIKNKEHKCKFCHIKFQTGRQLGGHVSRKHQGNSYQYRLRKQIQLSKACQRSRREFFKQKKKLYEVKLQYVKEEYFDDKP